MMTICISKIKNKTLGYWGGGSSNVFSRLANAKLSFKYAFSIAEYAKTFKHKIVLNFIVVTVYRND